MQSRQITNTIRASIDITKFNRKIEGYILLLDFEKCFDKIEYNAILGALRYFNFGEHFVTLSALLLYNFSSCTVNNGNMSEFFNVSRSCHQGCPIAPYFFVICGETLAHKIKENSNIHGIKVEDLEMLIAQYADDTQLFLKNRESLENVIKVLDEIEANTGLRVNYDKTSISCIGESKPFVCDKPLVWDPGGLNVLGINISDKADIQYSEILNKAAKILKKWDKRRLSVMGRVLVVNTLIASLFVYSMQVLNDPGQALTTEFNKLINKFIWKGKKEKIKLELLQNSIEDGGLNLVNFDYKNVSLKASWIVKETETARVFLDNCTPKHLGILFWDCSLSPEDAVKYVKKIEIDDFWKSCVISWFTYTWKASQAEPRTVDSVLWQTLWYNSHVRRSDEVFLENEWAKQGCVHLSDIINTHGNFKKFDELEEQFGNGPSWLEYQSLCSSIPKTWLNIIKKNTPVNPQRCVLPYEATQNCNKKSHLIYKSLQKCNPFPLESVNEKIKKKLAINVEEFQTAFSNIKK